MRELKDRCDELARFYVDRMAAQGRNWNFVQEIAVNYPLYVILSLLGLPESDFPGMLGLTQELFSGDDGEFQRDGGVPRQSWLRYWTSSPTSPELTASRRAHPPTIWHRRSPTRRSSEPLSDMGHCVLLRDRRDHAYHDTTSAAIAYGSDWRCWRIRWN